MKTNLLLPNRLKKVGWLLVIPSTILGIPVLFFDLELDFLRGKAFTVYCEGFTHAPTVFGVIDVNYTGTAFGLLFLIGAILVAFSKEKHEDEFIAKTRLESLVWATYVNYAILALCFVLFYSTEFLMVMILNMFTILIFFILRFYFIIYKSSKALGHEK